MWHTGKSLFLVSLPSFPPPFLLSFLCSTCFSFLLWLQLRLWPTCLDSCAASLPPSLSLSAFLSFLFPRFFPAGARPASPLFRHPAKQESVPPFSKEC